MTALSQENQAESLAEDVKNEITVIVPAWRPVRKAGFFHFSNSTKYCEF